MTSVNSGDPAVSTCDDNYYNNKVFGSEWTCIGSKHKLVILVHFKEHIQSTSLHDVSAQQNLAKLVFPLW